MAILWMGGEDIDFPNGATCGVSTTANGIRSGYARGMVPGGAGTASTPVKSTVFQGGAVTSCWLSFRVWAANGGNIGLGQSGQSNGLYLSISSSSIALGTVVAGTFTQLASAAAFGSPYKVDMQVVNYGSTSTVSVYLNGVQLFTYSGSTTVTGVSGFDSVFTNGFAGCGCSDIIVADEPTLAFQGLVTMAPNANGTTQQWSTPAYTNFNPTTINDANSTFTNTTGQDEQAGIISIPSGSFVVKAVKVVARSMATSGAASTNLKLGFRNGSGTVGVGSTHAVTTAFASYEDYFTTDPTTGAAWSSLTSYQLDLRSA